MSNFKKRYRDLEIEVLSSLRDRIESSNMKSSFSDSKAIEVNLFDYIELTLVNNVLCFIDSRGHHYSLFNEDNTLEDLIDILEE